MKRIIAPLLLLLLLRSHCNYHQCIGPQHNVVLHCKNAWRASPLLASRRHLNGCRQLMLL